MNTTSNQYIHNYTLVSLQVLIVSLYILLGLHGFIVLYPTFSFSVF